MTVAVIPARGGSKGVPGKNVAEVGGVPLVARTVRTARAVVDRVVVTTDDQAIGSCAVGEGADLVHRPADLAQDVTTTEEALVHALDQLGDVGEWFVLLQCTSPFLTAGDLERVCQPVRAGRADVAFAAAPFHGHIWQPTEAGWAGVNFEAYGAPTLPRQARPRQVIETGAAYAIRTAPFVACGDRFFGRVEAVECDPLRGIDIDTADDLALARLLAPTLDKEAVWST